MARRGLTLIELLVVVGAISLLLALSLPALMRARNQAQAAVCAKIRRPFRWRGCCTKMTTTTAWLAAM